MRTTLYEKVFIDGFHKPSYVVATLSLARLPAEADLAEASVRTLERHPRLRSLLRSRLGVPVAFTPRPPREWLERGGLRFLPSADVHALEETLLSTPMDLHRAMPIEVHLVGEPASLVVKVHHAVLDATSGFALFHDFARAVAGPGARSAGPRPFDRPPARRERRTISPWQRAIDWIARVQLRPRLPEVSLTASYHPSRMLDDEPVAYTERVLRGAFMRVAERARRRDATFSEFVASALLSAMNRYNEGRSSSPPREVGLMLARARPFTTAGGASFSADTCVVSIPAARLASPHDPATLKELRRAARDGRHNDLALAALYATRKLRGKSRAPSEQRALHFTLSDVTAFGRGASLPAGGLGVTDLRVLASPTSFDHAGVLVSRFGDDLRLSLVAHRGAVDPEPLLSATQELLEE